MSIERINEAAGLFRNAKNTVVFTGAGISTESGIPDFRSPGGVWTKYRTVYYDEFCNSDSARQEYWQQKSESHAGFFESAPNNGHLALAKWETTGQIRGVITQNIDGLHEVAGNRNVLELHGTARYVSCISESCSYRDEADARVKEFQSSNRVPNCPECSSPLKHATVSFGQSLPTPVLDEAVNWARECDLFLALGSSLVVTPAADLPRIAQSSGASLVIINRDSTPLDPIADLVINHGLGEALSAIDHLIS